MKYKITVIMVCLLVSILTKACSPTIQTRIVPQTVVVTRIVEIPITTTPLPTDTLLPATSTPTPTATPTPTEAIDWYQPDPKVMIVRYFTLLDLHLYEQAYDLLSTSSEYRTHNDQDKAWWISNERTVTKVIKVLQVVRYNDFLDHEGLRTQHTKVSDNWYMVSYYAEGKMAYPNGIQPLVYIRVIKEMEEWRIEEFSDLAYER